MFFNSKMLDEKIELTDLKMDPRLGIENVVVFYLRFVKKKKYEISTAHLKINFSYRQKNFK